MGYTSKFYKVKEISPSVWEKILVDFNKVLPKFIDKLDTTTDQKLQADNEMIYFNGIGEEAHETFYIDRVSEDSSLETYYTDERKGKYFECCKTARKDYDLAVSCVLIIAKRHLGEDIIVGSDGDNADEEWQNAKTLCFDVLGYGNLDMGDVYQDTDGKYKVKNPETLGKLLDVELGMVKQ